MENNKITNTPTPVVVSGILTQTKKIRTSRKVEFITCGVVLLTVIALFYLSLGRDAAYHRGQLHLGQKVSLKLPSGATVKRDKFANVVAVLKKSGYNDVAAKSLNKTTASDMATTFFALNDYLKLKAMNNHITVGKDAISKEQSLVASGDVVGYKNRFKLYKLTTDLFEIISENNAYENALKNTLLKQHKTTIIEAPWTQIFSLPYKEMLSAQSLMLANMNTYYRKLLVDKKSLSEIKQAIAGKSLYTYKIALSNPTEITATEVTAYPEGRPAALKDINKYQLPIFKVDANTPQELKNYRRAVIEETGIAKLKQGEVSQAIVSDRGTFVVARLEAMSGTQPFATWNEVTAKAVADTKKYY